MTACRPCSTPSARTACASPRPAGRCSKRCSPPSEPLTAEELAGDADLASTYRNLETLESIGIVRHVHLGHGPGRYELTGRSDGWATCEAAGARPRCPRRRSQAIRLAVREAAGFEPAFTHFPIVGRCRGLSPHT